MHGKLGYFVEDMGLRNKGRIPEKRASKRAVNERLVQEL